MEFTGGMFTFKFILQTLGIKNEMSWAKILTVILLMELN